MRPPQKVWGCTPQLILLIGLLTLLFIVLVSQNHPKYDILTIATPRRPSGDSFPRTVLIQARQIEGVKLWDALTPSFSCPNSSLNRVGKGGDGGKWTCGINHLGKVSMKSDQSSCVVYSFGVNADSSFEADVMSTTFCQVYAYDPTVKKIAPPLRPTNPRIRFKKIGIAGNDSTDRLTLKSMMLENGDHQWIDIVKMDVESAEYASLNNILDTFDEIPFGQLLIEFHLGGKKSQATAKNVISLIDRMERKGLRMFSKEKNPFCANCCEFSFINTNSLELFLDDEEIQKMVDSR